MRYDSYNKLKIDKYETDRGSSLEDPVAVRISKVCRQLYLSHLLCSVAAVGPLRSQKESLKNNIYKLQKGDNKGELKISLC